MDTLSLAIKLLHSIWTIWSLQINICPSLWCAVETLGHSRHLPIPSLLLCISGACPWLELKGFFPLNSARPVPIPVLAGWHEAPHSTPQAPGLPAWTCSLWDKLLPNTEYKWCFPSTLTSLPTSAEVVGSGFKIGSKIIESKYNSKWNTYISLTTRDLFSLSALPRWWPLQSLSLLKLPTPVPLVFTLNLSKSLNPTLVLP